MPPYKNTIPGQRWCPGCMSFLSTNDFGVNKAAKTGFQSRCRKCRKEYLNKPEFLQQNLEYKRTEKYRAYKSSYDAIRTQKPENKEQKQQYDQVYRSKNKDRVNDRYKNDVQFKLGKALRTRLRKALKNNTRKGSAVRNLGCTISEFKSYLEAKFQTGMNWSNWGHGDDKWHIDHIRPLCTYDLTNPIELLEACNYRNLQPLWQQENLRKSKKYHG